MSWRRFFPCLPTGPPRWPRDGEKLAEAEADDHDADGLRLSAEVVHVVRLVILHAIPSDAVVLGVLGLYGHGRRAVPAQIIDAAFLFYLDVENLPGRIPQGDEFGGHLMDDAGALALVGVMDEKQEILEWLAAVGPAAVVFAGGVLRRRDVSLLHGLVLPCI